MRAVLYVRGKFGEITTLGSKEDAIEALVQEAGKMIEFKAGDLPGINLHKLYYLKKHSINNYEIIGTSYRLEYLSSNRITLTNDKEV